MYQRYIHYSKEYFKIRFTASFLGLDIIIQDLWILLNDCKKTIIALQHSWIILTGNHINETFFTNIRKHMIFIKKK